jgi:hypothetical protein
MIDDAVTPGEEFIGTVDVGQLRFIRWPVLRELCRRYVESRELREYERQLLATGRWRRVRCEPRRDAEDGHVFNIYGVAAR